MKKLLIASLALMLALTACAARRHKLTAQGNVNLKTANVYYAQQNVEEALKYYNLVLKDNPDHALALRRVADINLYNGERFADRSVDLNKAAYENYDKAIKVMEKYEKPKEDELAAIRDMKKRRTSAWTRIYNSAVTQLQAGNTQEAIRVFEIASAIDPSSDKPLKQLFEIYQKDMKDPVKAETTLLKIYEMNPKNAEILENVGIFYYNQKKFEQAVPFFEKAKAADPLNVDNLLNLSASQYELGRYADAKINNQLVLNVDPNNINAITDAKNIAYKQDDKETALNYLKQLLAIRDNDSDYQEISFLLNELKQYQDLITYAKKWHLYDETNKDAVRLVILGASMTQNKALQAEYELILKNMQ